MQHAIAEHHQVVKPVRSRIADLLLLHSFYYRKRFKRHCTLQIAAELPGPGEGKVANDYQILSMRTFLKALKRAK